MDMNNNVKKHMDDLFRRCPDLRGMEEKIHTLYFNLETVFFKNKTLFLCGNGGSCSDSEHFIAELGKGFLSRRKVPAELADALEAAYPGEHYADRIQRGFRAISLNGHPSLASAYTNDVDPLMTYAQQLYIFGTPGDAVLGFTTSGNAKNILNLFKVARVLGISTYLMTGNNEEGLCRKYADFILDVPAREAWRVQEYHLPIYHTLAMMLEERFYGAGE